MLDRWQRQALDEAMLSSTERDEIKRLRAEFECMEQERDILKNRDQLPDMIAGSPSRLSHEPLSVYRADYYF